MTRATFSWLVDILRPRLEWANTEMREAIPVEQHVAIAVWWIINTTCYRDMGHHFAPARSAIAGIALEVCCAMEKEGL